MKETTKTKVPDKRKTRNIVEKGIEEVTVGILNYHARDIFEQVKEGDPVAIISRGVRQGYLISTEEFETREAELAKAYDEIQKNREKLIHLSRRLNAAHSQIKAKYNEMGALILEPPKKEG